MVCKHFRIVSILVLLIFVLTGCGVVEATESLTTYVPISEPNVEQTKYKLSTLKFVDDSYDEVLVFYYKNDTDIYHKKILLENLISFTIVENPEDQLFIIEEQTYYKYAEGKIEIEIEEDFTYICYRIHLTEENYEKFLSK